jgi:fused signal recognition particle receptor
MFGKLKEKLQNWTKNLVKHSEAAETPKSKKKEEKAKEKKVKEKSEKEIAKEVKKELKKEKKSGKKKEKEKSKEIELPTKFNIGTKSYEPDLEKLEEKVEELEEEKNKPGSKSFFQRVTSGINKVKISEKEFEIYSEELEMLLLENNVALEVAEKIVKALKEKIVGQEFLKKEIEFAIKNAFSDIIREILISPPDLIEEIKEKNILGDKKEPYIILFCGINGSGKTTTIAKIAEHLKRKKISCVLAAGDTFRAASIEQLKTHGEKIGVKVIAHDYGADPASVGFDAIQYAKKNFINCVLIDTAGRMHTQKNLLREMEKIVKVCKPDKKIFVGESITGNDAIEQVRSFDEIIGIDGIVLTKADIDEKGGTALSVGYVTKKPIFYLGTGQEYEKIEPFSKEKFIEKLGL